MLSKIFWLILLSYYAQQHCYYAVLIVTCIIYQVISVEQHTRFFKYIICFNLHKKLYSLVIITPILQMRKLRH